MKLYLVFSKIKDRKMVPCKATPPHHTLGKAKMIE